MRILITLAVNNDWTLKTTDIKSAFLQGKLLEREVYVTPPREAQSGSWKVWKLKKALYGLNDAARQFYMSVEEQLYKLGLKRCSTDPALFIWEQKGEVKGLLATHVDDFMHCGVPEFDDIMDRLRKRFIAGKLEEKSFAYVGFDIEQTEDCILLNQQHYMEDLPSKTVNPSRARQKEANLSKDENKLFRSLVGKCNWAARGTRPDLAYEVVDLSTKFNNASVEDLVRVVKLVQKLRSESGNAFIKYTKLGKLNHCYIVVMSDASFANMKDGVSSCGGHIVMFVGENNNCCIIAWKSGKIKRVVRSTLAAEMLSLSEGLKHGIYIQHIVQEITSMKIPIVAFVDNKSVVDSLHSTKQVDDKRLRIDISLVKEMLTKEDVIRVKWVPGSCMIADILTKRGVAPFAIIELVQSGKFSLESLE